MSRNVAQANQAALKAKLEETERDVQRKLILARTANVSKADLTGTQARRDAETADVLAATEQINVKDEAIVVAEADLRIAEANLDNAEAIVEEKQAALLVSDLRPRRGQSSCRDFHRPVRLPLA